MNIRCLSVFALGFMTGVIALIIGSITLGAVTGLNPAGLNITLNTTLPGIGLNTLTGGEDKLDLPWLFPGAYAKYKAYGAMPFQQTEFEYTLRVDNVAGDKATITLATEGLTISFPVDLTSRESIIDGFANGIMGEPAVIYYTDTYTTVFGERTVTVAEAGNKKLIIDEETLWPLAYIETNPDMQAIAVIEITSDTNIPLE